MLKVGNRDGSHCFCSKCIFIFYFERLLLSCWQQIQMILMLSTNKLFEVPLFCIAKNLPEY